MLSFFIICKSVDVQKYCISLIRGNGYYLLAISFCDRAIYAEQLVDFFVVKYVLTDRCWW